MRNIFMISVVAIMCLCLTNCSDNPQKIGEKIGQEYCDCQKDYAKEQDKVYQDFLANFDSYGFKTRQEARQKWQDAQDGAKKKFDDCRGKIDEEVKEARAKFPTDISNLLDPNVQRKYMENPQKYLSEFTKNQEKAKLFEDALRDAANKCDASNKTSDFSKIDEKIRAIIPQQPDEANLRKNLINRRITEQSGGYFGNGWGWQITSPDDIKDLKIVKEEKVGNDYDIDVHLVLQKGQSSQYEADLTITSVLGQDDWGIDFIKTNDIHIDQTGRYNNCITTEVKKGWGISLQFTNTCDVVLIVGGQILGNDGTWTKFSTMVNANGMGSISYNGKDYKIDFIERQ